MQLVVNVVQLAALYCLICCGYVLIYRTSRVLNLAHGEFMAMGGYFLFTVTVYLIADPISSFIIACFLSLVLGFGVYFFLMRFMAGESVFAAVLVTVALGILLRGLMTLIWTSQSWHPLQNMKVENASHQLFEGAVISTFGIVMVASTVVLYLTLFLSFKFTRWGLRMRAVGEHPLLASQRGIGLHKFYALSWGIAVFSGGLAGMIQACDTGLEPGMFIIGLKAFPVVLVGGLDSLAGVIVGAFVVALAEILCIQYISPQASEVAPFAVLLFMLLIRPWGLFGTKEELERV
ncbi:MAG: branched-chain amino acid ABC transporter permease [Desulfobacterales bacterium]|jgi:branched-chain amino acid transport system permease protein|nr:branched-chain amino acid ABC transporter permease [Desulfobacterales bacterium]